MNIRTLLAVAATLMLGLTTAPTKSTAQPIVLKFPHDVPTNQIKGMGADRLRKLVAERMKGRVVIQVEVVPIRWTGIGLG